jgi:hypothetical protein
MVNTERYERYCYLLSDISDKESKVRELQKQREVIQYSLDTLERELEDYSDMASLSKLERDYLNTARLKHCFNKTVNFDTGGTIHNSPLATFKKTEDYSYLDKKERSLFKEVEPSLKANQFKLKNALFVSELLGQKIEPNDSAFIDDYIDETVRHIPSYDEKDSEEIKKLKEIMYIFVQHTSK